jgi:anti-sigma factor RsiW
VVPDLTDAGLTLIGGRLLPGDKGAAGMLMYQDQTGARVTLFLEAGQGDENTFAFRTDGDTNMLAWRDPEMAYVLTGPFDRTTLTNAAHFVHAAQD